MSLNRGNLQEADRTAEKEYRFQVTAWWSAGRTGIAKSDSAPNAIHFTSPPAFGGLEGRWTPEDMLLCALASCYIATFSALSETANLNYSDLEVEVDGTFCKVGSAFEFTEIVIRPRLRIPCQQVQERALSLLQKAKARCLVSRALAVEQRFEPSVELGQPEIENSPAVEKV